MKKSVFIIISFIISLLGIMVIVGAIETIIDATTANKMSAFAAAPSSNSSKTAYTPKTLDVSIYQL